MYKVYISTFGMYWSDHFNVPEITVNLYTLQKLLDTSHLSMSTVTELISGVIHDGKVSYTTECTRGGRSIVRIEAV